MFLCFARFSSVLLLWRAELLQRNEDSAQEHVATLLRAADAGSDDGVEWGVGDPALSLDGKERF